MLPRLSPWVLLAVVVPAGCGPTPQPLPPPGVFAEALTIADQGDGTVVVSGAEGALSGADRLEIAVAGDLTPPTLIELDVTGSTTFSVTLAAEDGDAFRFQAFNSGEGGEQESVPIQLTAAGQTFTQPFRHTCATVVPTEELVLGAANGMGDETGTITVDNQCALLLGVDAARLADDAGWEVDVDGTDSADLLTGVQAAVNVTRSTALGGERNVLTFELNGVAMDRDRRIVILRANR